MVDGLVVGERATVVAVDWHGAGTVQVVYRTSQGVAERLLSRDDEARLSVATADRPWTLDAPGHAFKLASEALRIHLAHLFDPYLAVQGSNIDPLPHQIEAVYQEMLPRQPLRFLLADDPGAGKTIMSGLLIRELDIRGDADRVLIVAPGSLVEQWQEELHNRFHLSFDIFSRDMVEAALAGNPFKERPRLIARLDQLARNEELQERLKASEWDLVVVDEAHKMSAHLYGRKLEKTKRYRVGEILRGITRHFLLLTATPHNGKEEEFHLFLALLDPDRFEGRLKGEDIPDYSDVMRRYIKEKLLTFDGRRLFPERFAISAKYELSEPEQELYEAVTSYVREGMYRAKQMEEGGDRRRGLAVGFALAALQRRLASSPQAIHRSLERRRDRLEKRLGEMRDIAEGKVTPGTFAKSGVNFDDFDFDDFRDDELE
ncbi:MAG: DEAD/DEAH box helicase, partial [bacterium]|nr:DEAD/DEAH box helicase [bacterium]